MDRRNANLGQHRADVIDGRENESERKSVLSA